MSILGLDKNGAIVELGADAPKQAQYVEDGNVAFTEYSDKAAKKLGEIKLAKIAENKARARAMQQKRMALAQRLAAKQAENKAVKKKINSLRKNIASRKSDLYLESYAQPNPGYDYTSLTGNPFAGFKAGGEFVNNPNLHFQGKKEKIEQVPHFGCSTILGYDSYDGSIGFSIPDIMKNVIEPVTKSLPSPVKSYIKLVALPYTAPAQIASALVTGGLPGAKEETQTIIKTSASDIREVRSVLDETAKPVTSPLIQTAGVIWETAPVRLLRGIVFNKYTDPGYTVKRYHKVAKMLPGGEEAWDTIDRYTGDSLTQIEIATAVPGKLGRNERVSKAELLIAAVVALKAGAVAGAAFTGGATMAIIGLVASQMRQGPLGQTETGRAILTLAEIGAYAYGGYATGAVSGTAGTSLASSAGSAAASSAATAGASASQQAATQAVVTAIAAKAQSTAANKTAQEVAKTTNTGVIGRIAVSSALGPQTFEDSVKEQGSAAAAGEVGKQTGPTGQIIAEATVAAAVRTDAAPTTSASKQQVFQGILTEELEKRIRAEGLKALDTEVKKALGPEAGEIFMAAARGEDVGEVAQAELEAAARKALVAELTARTNNLELTNAQKLGLINQINKSFPEQREDLFNQALTVDVNMIAEQAKRNQNLQSLGYVPGRQQAAISDNSRTALVPGVSDKPDTSLTIAEREKRAEFTQQQEAEKLTYLQDKYFTYAIKVNLGVGELKELGEKADALRGAGKIAEAELVEAQMAILNKDILANEQSAMLYAQMMEIQKIQGGIKVAAAKEGRYNPYASEIAHPMAKYALA